MSRMRLKMLLPILSAGIASPVLAQQVTAEQAIEDYRETFQPTGILDCPRDPGEITVCGKRPESDPNRIPSSGQRMAGDRIRLVPGEAPRAGLDVGGCIRLCHRPVSVNILAAVPVLVKGIRKILDPDR